MGALVIDKFGGMVPALGDRLLAQTAAAHSENTWLYSGELRALPAPTLLRACTLPATTKVFRIPTDYTDADHMLESDWLEFGNLDTDVIRAPIVNDSFDRYYWASTSEEPRYNTHARITAGDPDYILGIPAPPAAPGLSVVGGGSPTTTRAYVVTWESTFGEEGPPSPAVTVTGNADGTWTLVLAPATGGDIVDRTLAFANIYRTVTSGAGIATYFFVAQVAMATVSYGDTATDAAVALNDQLESTGWIAPPTDLQGFVTMPNGMVAGWRENEVLFCQPYRPHAWPAAYTLAVEYPIVGLGVVNQTLVVCTQGFPVTMTGSSPETITESKLTTFEPCMSRGSILSTPEGVYYGSPNGIVGVVPGSAANITRELITKDKWNSLASVPTLRAARLGTAYYAWGSARAGVFDSDAFDPTAFVQSDFTGAYRGVLVDPTNPRVAFNVLHNDTPAYNVMSDPWTGEVFVIRDNSVYWINQAETEPVFDTYVWRSKVFQLPDKANISVFKVFFEVSATAPALAAERNVDAVQTLAADQYALVRVYGDGRLINTRELRTSGELLRVASGFKADFWQFEIEGRVTVHSLQVASTVKELNSV